MLSIQIELLYSKSRYELLENPNPTPQPLFIKKKKALPGVVVEAVEDVLSDVQVERVLGGAIQQVRRLH